MEEKNTYKVEDISKNALLSRNEKNNWNQEYLLVKRKYHQNFQGACPEDQRSSRRLRSRNVSIGCQNPECL